VPITAPRTGPVPYAGLPPSFSRNRCPSYLPVSLHAQPRLRARAQACVAFPKAMPALA